MQVDLYPAGRAGDVLAVILRPPTLDEAHPNRAHFSEFIHGLEAVINALRQQLGELGVVEYPQRTACGDLADGRRVKAVVVVAVPGLDEYRGIRQAFGVHLPVHVVQVDSLADVPPGVLYRGIPVDVAELAEAESVAVIAGVREPVHDHRRRMAMENLTDPAVQLIVGYGGPERLLLVRHRLDVGAQRRFGAGVVVCVRIALVRRTVSGRWRFC